MKRTSGCVVLIVSALFAAGCSRDSEAQSAEAVIAPADQSAPHGNHDPSYGGVLYMHRDLHFEVVFDRAGRHRVYFSDAVRAELPAAVVSGVRLEVTREGHPSVETLAARIDESGESWVADGMRIDSATTARVSFVTRDGPYWIDVPVLPAPAP